MKRLLNTLYVLTRGAYLSKDGEAVAVKVDGVTKARFPVRALESIVCFGSVGISPQLMALCAEHGVTVVFMSEWGRFWARVEGGRTGNVLLRRAQFRAADDPAWRTRLAKSFVIGKVSNTQKVLRRALRDHPGKIDRGRVVEIMERLRVNLSRLRGADDLDVVRGIEGESANLYFSVFDQLIVSQRDDFAFRGRSRRPPRDRVNALLSFLYALLTNDIVSALEGVGLDPYVGFLHGDRAGRPGLALDMLEEFRPLVADRLALSLINLRVVTKSMFTSMPTGAVLLNDAGRKTVIEAYQQRKQEKVFHPFVGEQVKVGLLYHVQALLLARHLRGDLDAYPPFTWR